MDIMAIGVGVYSAIPGGAFNAESGTSIAAPIAAAAFTVLRSLNPTRSVDDLEAALEGSGHKIVDPASSAEFPVVQIAKAEIRLASGLPLTRAAGASLPGSNLLGQWNEFIVELEP